MNTLEMREHYFAVQRMPMLETGVIDYRIGDHMLVLTLEVPAAARTRLAVRHRAHLRRSPDRSVAEARERGVGANSSHGQTQVRDRGIAKRYG